MSSSLHTTSSLITLALLSVSAGCADGKTEVCHWSEDDGQYVILSASTDGDYFQENPDDLLPGAYYVDSDGDGVGDHDAAATDCPAGLDGWSTDNADAFPDDPDESLDSDSDGVGDNADAFPDDADESLDSDGDGVGDNGDAFPADPDESMDSDGDGVGDNADAFPDDASETVDSDGDGVGDNGDAFPSDASESVDSDGDGVGDNADAFPDDASESVDSDGDGVGDNSDVCPSEAATLDEDGDGCEDWVSSLSCDCDSYDACQYDSSGALSQTYTLAAAGDGVYSGITASGLVEICEGEWHVQLTLNDGAEVVGDGPDRTVLSDRDGCSTLPTSIHRYGNGSSSSVIASHVTAVSLEGLAFEGNCGGEKLMNFYYVDDVTLTDISFSDNGVGTRNTDHGLIWFWNSPYATLDGVSMDDTWDIYELVHGHAWSQGNHIVIYDQTGAGTELLIQDSSFDNAQNSALTDYRSSFGVSEVTYDNVSFSGNGDGDFLTTTLSSPYSGVCDSSGCQ